MMILGIETSGAVGSVALCDDERVLGECRLEEGPQHSRQVMAAIDSLVKRTAVDKGSIEAVAVSEGPGSFTGLRIGVTCAKCLAYALGWKAVGVPSLEVQAQNVDPRGEGAVEFVCPVLDARRKCVHAAVFGRDRRGWKGLTGTLVGPPEQVAEAIPDGALVFGSGVREYADVFARRGLRIGGRELEEGRAEQVARLGLSRIREGKDVSPAELVPKYYRLTAAEQKLLSKRQDRSDL